ncbi:hypothetical protein BOX15_Mlig024211g2, partial [Macrostomum lignano]
RPSTNYTWESEESDSNSHVDAMPFDQSATRVVEGDQSEARFVEGDQSAARVVEGDQSEARFVEGDQSAARVVEGDQSEARFVEGDQTAARVVEGDQSAARVDDGDPDSFFDGDGDQVAKLVTFFKNDSIKRNIRLLLAASFILLQISCCMTRVGLEKMLRLARFFGANIPVCSMSMKDVIYSELEDTRAWINCIQVCQVCSLSRENCACSSQGFGDFYAINIKKQVTLIVKAFHSDIEQHYRAMKAGFQYVLTSCVDQLKSPYDIHLLLNADSVCFYNTKSDSMWPIQATILNLSPKLRQSKRCTILLGLWSSKCKPKLDGIFDCILQQVPTSWSVVLNSKIKKTVDLNLSISHVVCDLPALAIVIKLNAHNGFFACPMCEDPGQSLRTENGGTVMCYGIVDSFAPRTAEKFRQCARLAQQARRDTVFGIKSVSRLSALVEFPTNILLDTMHMLFEGIVKKLLQYAVKNLLGRHLLESINCRLQKQQVPHDMPRFKTLDLNLAAWRAHDFKNFSLYLIAHLLVPSLRDNSSKKLFMSLVAMLHSFYSTNINEASARTRSFLHHLDKCCPKRFQTLNVHLLLHIPTQMQRFGSVDKTSLFSFESRMNMLKGFIQGTRFHAQQIVQKFCLQQVLQAYLHDQNIPQLLDILNCNKTDSKSKAAFSNGVQVFH